MIQNNTFTTTELDDFKINDLITHNSNLLKKYSTFDKSLLEKNDYLIELKSLIENQQLLQLSNKNHYSSHKIKKI